MTSLSVFLGVLGVWQIAVIVVLVLLLFGGKKIPELMRGLGSGIKEFKDATREDEDQYIPPRNNSRTNKHER